MTKAKKKLKYVDDYCHLL